MAGEAKTIKCQCNRCNYETHHHVRFTHSVRDSQDTPDGECIVDWGSTYTFLECCGCSEVSVRRRDWCSEWDRGDYHETFFPPRVSRSKPSNFDSLPEEYQSLIDEIYTALHSDSRQLAMMGARAVIDLFILRKVGDKGTFANGMEQLEADGYISKRNREIVKAAIDAGHAAAHRAHIPTSKELNAVMDIIENLLEHDLLVASAETLRKHTPPRAPRSSRKKEEKSE